MRFKSHTTSPDRVQVPMVPLIDVIFQLLIFFLLNLRIITPESNFNLNMPSSAPTIVTNQHAPHEIKVGLRSDRDGNLTQLTLDSKELGNDDIAFERLNKEILAIIGRPGNPLTKDIEVEIDTDFETQYKYVVQAIAKCTGRYDPSTKQIARYIEKIKFSPTHPPKTF